MQSGSCGENLRWTLDDDGTLTISGEGYMNNYFICTSQSPWLRSERVKKIIINHGVTSIGRCAFYNCTSLTSVTIGNSVTLIGESAFFECRGLTSVTIPDSVTSIGKSAFSCCESLRNVTIPDSVTSIGDNAFSCCYSLTSVTIGNSVTLIGESAFFECRGLTSVTIPDSVTSIGECAFSWCKSLTSVTIPNSVTSIGEYAFDSCYSLTSVTIPDSVTSIGEDAFGECTNLKKIYYKAGSGLESKLSDGNNAKLIPMTSAKDVWWQFDDGTLTVGCVREVEDYSREVPPWNDYLDVIQRLVIESGVTKIFAHAFDNCPRLEVVTLPASVKTIGDMAFPFSFCGDFNVNGGKNVFWCVEDGVLVVKKNPAAVGEDFSIGTVRCWRDVEKNIRGVKVEHGIKPTQCFNDWLFERVDGKQISFG